VSDNCVCAGGDLFSCDGSQLALGETNERNEEEEGEGAGSGRRRKEEEGGGERRQEVEGGGGEVIEGQEVEGVG
jgi:hypothetical protein